MMNFSIALEQHRDSALFELSGEFDGMAAPTYCDCVSEQLRRGVCRFIIDLNNLEYIDSQGIHALLTSLRAAQERRGGMCLVISNERIAHVLAVAGIDKVFDLYQHRATALAHDG